jgi:hypothetical protein
MPIIPATRRWKQEDLEFEASQSKVSENLSVLFCVRYFQDSVLSQLASNYDTPNSFLLGSQDYKREPLAPSHTYILGNVIMKLPIYLS